VIGDMENKTSLLIKDIQKVSSERLPVDKVERMIDFLGVALDIPKERLDAARDFPVYLVDKNTFYEEVTKYNKQLGFEIPEEYVLDDSKREGAEAMANIFGTTVEEIKAKRTKLLEKYYRENSEIRGISICSKKGEKKILINRDEVPEIDRDEVLSHELLHSMVNTSKKGSGFNSETGYGHYLNEATVQLMNLRARYKEMDWIEFGDRIIDRSIKSAGYESQMDALIVLMRATSFGEKEFTFEKLKESYFNEEETGIKAFLVKIELIRNIPDTINKNFSMKKKMQNLFEERLEGVRESRTKKGS